MGELAPCVGVTVKESQGCLPVLCLNREVIAAEKRWGHLEQGPERRGFEERQSADHCQRGHAMDLSNC